jgi:DNA-binding response OmpR family regulator
MLNVALYEDNDLMRALLDEWLSEAGYRVVPEEETPDLVIASISMPRQAGLIQVREIQDRHPGVPIIAISAQARSGLSSAGPAAGTLGVRQVIAKPLAREELLGAVRAIIGTPA